MVLKQIEREVNGTDENGNALIVDVPEGDLDGSKDLGLINIKRTTNENK